MTIAAKKDILDSFISNPTAGFENIFSKIRHLQKETCRSFLIYIHTVLAEYRNYQLIEGVRFIHLHMPLLDEPIKQVTLEYIAIRYFYEGLENDQLQNNYILTQIESFARKLNNLQIPEKASGAKGNREYRQWESGRKETRNVIKFLKDSMFNDKGFLPKTIVNLYNNDAIVLKERCQEEWYSTTLELLQNKRSYVLLNTDQSNEDIVKDLNEAELLKNINNIILFDCEGRKLFRGFNKRYLDELLEYDMPIQCLVLFSFEKRAFRLRNTLNRYQQIYSNFYVQPKNFDFDQSYLFPKSEKDLLCNKQLVIESSLDWIGERSEIFEDYLDIVKDVGIDKLRSIPILNIYSFCFTKNVAEIILKALFEEFEGFKILDAETKLLMHDLEKDEKEQLKQSISLLLSLVIQQWEKIKEKIVKAGSKGPIAIVVPHQGLDNKIIQKELKILFPYVSFKLYTWNDIKEITINERSIIILAYRDVGIPPFDIYPNIIEHRIPEDRSVHLVFMKMFFFERFKSSIHRYLVSYNKLVSNELRYKYLNWKEMDKSIEDINASRGEYLIDADDSDYGISSQTESIRIEFTDLSHTSLYQSKLLVARKQGIHKYFVIRADDLLEEAEAGDFEVEALEEIYEELNLFEITPAEENKLKEIKIQYGLTGKDQKYALWKVELRKKLEQHGGNPALLYETIKNITGNDNKFIQYSYFRDYWLDVKSDLIIPRRTRHFRQICNYLGLPNVYYRLKLKQRASLRSNSRQSNAQMNSLLVHMFSEGLFEKNVDWDSLDLSSFIDEHNLEEKGIFQENVRKELEVLVDLLRDEMKLKRVLKVEIS